MKLYNLKVPVLNEAGDDLVIDESTDQPVIVDNNNFTAAEVNGESVLTDVEYEFFDNVKYSVKLKIDDSKKIKDFSFANMPFLEEKCCGRWIRSIKIPEGVTSIGVGAFDECYRLSSVTIPDSVTSIGVGVFGGCSNLSEITYNGTVEQWQQIDGYQNILILIHCSDGDYVHKLPV